MSLARLLAAARLCEDPDLSLWLSGACRKISRGVPPDMALDLTGVGARRESDRLLFQAACHLGKEGDSLWFLACTIADRLVNPRRNDIVQELINMADAAYRLPRSERRIYGRLLNRRADAMHDETSVITCKDDAPRDP